MEFFHKFFSFLQENNRRVSGFLFVLCFIVHAPVLFNGYNLDDELVTRNHRLTSKGIAAIPDIYSSPYYEDDQGYSYGYRPTTLASFAIEHQFFGDSPFAGHFINLLLYGITTCLLYIVLIWFFPNQRTPALICSILFAIHPIHVEVVASLKNRDELLALLFPLIGTVSFTRLATKNKPIASIALIASMALGITSKFNSVYFFLVCPFLLSMVDIRLIGRIIIYGILISLTSLTLTARNASLGIPEFVTILTLMVLISEGLVESNQLAISSAFVKIRSVLMRLILSCIEFITSFWRLLIIKPVAKSKSFVKSVVNFFHASIRSFKEYLFRAYSGRLIMDISKTWYISLLSAFILMGDKYSLALLIMLPTIWNKLSKRTQEFISRYNIHLIVISSVITSVSDVPFFIFFISYSVGTTWFVNDSKAFKTNFAGLASWIVISGIDIFFGSGEFRSTDIIFISVYFTILLLQLIGFSFRPDKSVGKQIATFVILNIAGISLIYGLTESVDFTMLLILLALVTITGIMKAKYDLTNNRFSSTLVPISLVIFLLVIQTPGIIITSQNRINEALERLEPVELHVLPPKFFQTQINLVDKSIGSIIALPKYRDNWNEFFLFLKSWINPDVSSSQFVDSSYKPPSSNKSIYPDSKRPLDFVENPMAHITSKSVIIANAIYNTSWILWKTTFPFPQSYYYGYNEIPILNLSNSRIILLFTILLGLSILTILVLLKFRLHFIGFGLIIWIGGAFLFSGVFEQVPGVLAERFGYLASIGFCMLLSGVFSKLLDAFQKKAGKIIIAGLLALIITISSGFTVSRAQLWKDKITLMRNDIETVPNSAQAHNLLASALMEKAFNKSEIINANQRDGLVHEAEIHFEKAIKIYPQFFNVLVDLGKTNESLNQPEKAISYYEDAVKLDSSYSILYEWIGRNAESIENFPKAQINFELYLNQHPTQFEAFDNLARVLFKQGKFDESIEVCQDYLKIDSTNKTFQENILYMQMQQLKESE